MFSIYLYYLFLLGPIALFLIDLLSENRKLKITLRTVNTVMLLIAFAAVTFIGFLFVAFSFRGIRNGGWTFLTIPGACVLTGVLLIGIVWHCFKKKFLLWVGIPLLLCVGATVGIFGYDSYIDNIPTVSEDFGIYRYNPANSDNILVTLKEPATLKLTENYPRMNGATALYPVYAAFANALYPETALESYPYPLQCNKTDGAYDAIVEGDADIIFVASPSKTQAAAAAEKGVELVFTPIGRECFVFFVNSKNKLNDISAEQLRKIYSGDLTYWEDLGVKGLGTIRPFQRSEGSGSQTYLQRFMGDVPIMTAETEDIFSAMEGIITQVANYKNYKNAIGFSFRFYATEMVQNNNIKLLSIDGVAPTKENIINETYPLSGYFYAVTRSDASEETLKLVDWILSPQGQELIEKTGYVGLE